MSESVQEGRRVARMGRKYGGRGWRLKKRGGERRDIIWRWRSSAASLSHWRRKRKLANFGETPVQWDRSRGNNEPCIGLLASFSPYLFPLCIGRACHFCPLALKREKKKLHSSSLSKRLRKQPDFRNRWTLCRVNEKKPLLILSSVRNRKRDWILSKSRRRVQSWLSLKISLSIASPTNLGYATN